MIIHMYNRIDKSIDWLSDVPACQLRHFNTCTIHTLVPSAEVNPSQAAGGKATTKDIERLTSPMIRPKRRALQEF